MLGAIVGAAVALHLWSAPVGALLEAPELAAEVNRLEGQKFQIENGRYEILDIAGEGPPKVGCVYKEDGELVLVSDGSRLPLRGPLAIPRIAGPRYKVWVIGTATNDGGLFARRLGILAGPASCPKTPKASI
mgnify:CR=1 FL=1